jgi:hypothetical protein
MVRILSNLKNIINHKKHGKFICKKKLHTGSIGISNCGKVIQHKKGMSFPRKRESSIFFELIDTNLEVRENFLKLAIWRRKLTCLGLVKTEAQ